MKGVSEKREQAVDASYPVLKDYIPQRVLETPKYQVYFASTKAELAIIQKLRAQVFYGQKDGLDEDKYDAVCHHLLVKHIETGEIVGTYRMQTYEMAQMHYGFYSDSEYILSDFPVEVLKNAVEIGRACVEENHRNGRVLYLLWRGLALYLEWNQKRYLFGCSSLFSIDPRDGYEALAYFKKEGKVHDSIWVQTRPKYSCEFTGKLDGTEPKVPKLLNVYMNLGAKVCSPPALDRDFKCLDFLTVFDLQALNERAYASFFGE